MHIATHVSSILIYGRVYPSLIKANIIVIVVVMTVMRES